MYCTGLNASAVKIDEFFEIVGELQVFLNIMSIYFH
jgi:hypothetical protein